MRGTRKRDVRWEEESDRKERKSKKSGKQVIHTRRSEIKLTSLPTTDKGQNKKDFFHTARGDNNTEAIFNLTTRATERIFSRKKMCLTSIVQINKRS